MDGTNGLADRRNELETLAAGGFGSDVVGFCHASKSFSLMPR